MEKMFQSEFNGYIRKYYDLKDDSVVELLAGIKNANVDGLIMSVREDTDGEMMSISGTYSADKLIENYDYYMSEALYPAEVKINCAGEYLGSEIIVSISPVNKDVTLITKNDALELPEIVKKNEYANTEGYSM